MLANRTLEIIIRDTHIIFGRMHVIIAWTGSGSDAAAMNCNEQQWNILWNSANIIW